MRESNDMNSETNKINAESWHSFVKSLQHVCKYIIIDLEHSLVFLKDVY